MAILPTQIRIAMNVQSEPLFLVLLLGAACFLLGAADRPSSNLAVVGGALLAAAALTRSSALALPLLFAAYLLDRRHPRRVNAHIAMSAALGFALVLLPWTIRNAFVFRELILVNDGAGCVFYGRNADVALREARARNRAELDEAARATLERQRARTEALAAAVGDSPGRLSRALFREAWKERRNDPSGTATLLAWKASAWLKPYPDPRYWPAWSVAAVGVTFCALGVLFVAGLVRAERRGVAGLCLAYLSLTMLVHVIMESSWRYRTAYWDPVVLLYAASGAAALLPDERRRAAAGA
jgi:hypothetical protein